MREAITRELEEFIATLSEENQRRFNEGLQKALVESLFNQTVYSSVIEMFKEQENIERDLFANRQCLLRDLQGDPDLEEKLLKNDTRIMILLDELSERQQVCLYNLKVPGFRITKNGRDIELQMMILEFIKELKCIPYKNV
uniref:Protein NLRC3-like n=1 Tax=Heterorhabditis bacteriophora TaxID=37862 RepID=A0A1I7X5Y6_HETBA